MYCKNCGREIDDTSVFCSACGTRVASTVTPANCTTQRGLANSKRKRRKSVGGVLCLLAVVLLIAIFGKMHGATTRDSQPTEALSPSESIAAEQAEKEIFISNFCRESGFSEAVGENLYVFLSEQLHCKEIRFLWKNSTDATSWDINTSNYMLTVSADEDGIYSAVCGSYTMYDGEQILYTCDDLALRDTSEYRSHYITIAKGIVESALKAPSTAQFQDSQDLKIQRNGNLVAVQGYVDSQNSFGAMIRSDFLVEFRILSIEDLTYEVVYLQIGDEIAGEFLDLD